MELGDLILIPNLDNVVLIDKNDGNKSIDGTLCISSHHLLWSPRHGNGQELWLLHRNIDLMEKKLNTQSPGGSIILKCKDFRVLQIDINSSEDFMNVVQSIEDLSSQDQTLQYPFFNKPQITNNTLAQDESGWNTFSPLLEWSKLLSAHDSEWRISYINKNYKICNSYPSVLIVPRHIEDKTIISSASFRDGGRFPVLCHRHEGGSILLRSSQPMCGTNAKRCKEDEKLLNAVLGLGRRGYIIDTRTISQAQSCRAKGGGTELDAAYPQWRKVHKAIPRPHDLADSFFKLIEACNDTTCSTSQWIWKLDNGGWLSTLQSTLNAACVTAQCLHQEVAAVLVHGSTGRDSTLVVTSLAQVILNPECRTVRGLEGLIEREWIQAGHQFFSRTRHGPYHPASSQNSTHAPTFLLFLDCLYQLHYQFQFSFEYTPELLKELYNHAYCSNYGTFLGDSEAERTSIRLSERTYSLWSYINQPEVLEKWLNPLYEPNPAVIWPSVAPVSIQLWKDLYFVHTSIAPWKDLIPCTRQIKQNYMAVRKVAGQLQTQIKKALEDLHSKPNVLYEEEDQDERICIAQLSLESQNT